MNMTVNNNRIANTNWMDVKRYIRKANIGKIAFESTALIKYRIRRVRDVNSKRFNTQPNTYPGINITKGKRKNARIEPRRS